MASIRDLKITNSLIGNRIFAFLGKAKPMGNNACLVESEKKDITNHCLLAVAALMKEELKRDALEEPMKDAKAVISQYKIEGLGYLQFSNHRPYHKDGEIYIQTELRKAIT